tara:strand:+ start:105 stop:449 length:345 start_codon:yes stop_codon:yes gene_type:complete
MTTLTYNYFMEEKEYLDIGGKDFVLDFEKLGELVKLPPLKYTNDDGDLVDDGGATIDVTKYEMIREMVGTMLQTGEVVDDKLGVMALNSLPIAFKISYNTLIHYDILKEIEDNE